MNRQKVSQHKVPPTKEEILETLEGFHGDTETENTDTNEVSSTENQLDLNLPSLSSDFSPSIESNGDADDEVVISPSTSVSITNSYCLEWERLFGQSDFVKQLRAEGLEGELRSCRFRSVIWRLYLEVLPENICDWVDKTREWRQKYDQVKNMVLVNPRHNDIEEDLTLNNPLSQEKESPWNQFFEDNELRITIKQDVVRTFPELQFFHTESVREMMCDILFLYARSNHRISYKQGMHELLAPLIFVLHCDHQAFLHAAEMESIEGVVREVLDPAYLEHDAYAMFSQVMDTVELWYVSKEFYPRRPAGTRVNAQPFARPDYLNPSNIIVTKLTRIQDYILKKHDLELHMHLERLDIAPQIYGIRWVRLLFGREYTMQDLLVVWDAIFADGISFDLVDYLFVAMLLYIRDVLLSSDYPTCLHILMRYPPVGDVNNLIQSALYLRDSNNYPKPPMYTFQRILPEWGIVGDQNRSKTVVNQDLGEKFRPNAVMSGFATLTKKMNIPSSLIPKTKQKPKQSSKPNRTLPKSSSEPMNLLTDSVPDDAPVDRKLSASSLSEQSANNALTTQAFKPIPSANSIARLDTLKDQRRLDGNEESKYATLPARSGRKKNKGENKKVDQELNGMHKDPAYLQGKLNEMSSMHHYCSTKLDGHIGKLQRVLLKQNLENEDDILLALAGLKQVKDILKGSLKFSHSLVNEDEIKIKDNHYQEQSHAQHSANQKNLFYLSSNEPSADTSPISDKELNIFESAPDANSSIVPTNYDTGEDNVRPETKLCNEP